MSRDALAEGRRWLDQADHDLATAELLIEHERAPVACFLAQQAAEKALTGLLYRHDADVYTVAQAEAATATARDVLDAMRARLTADPTG